MAHVSDIKLIRTDTTLDLSQKAEKDDDKKGVERSDLFIMAVDYGKLDDNLPSVEIDIQMLLHALHKVATKDPCCQAQHMTF
ncbi:hypothetical protein R6Q59_003227 [Mikania micrantha]